MASLEDVRGRRSTRNLIEALKTHQRRLNLSSLKDLAMRSFLLNLRRFRGDALQLIEHLPFAVKSDILSAISMVPGKILKSAFVILIKQDRYIDLESLDSGERDLLEITADVNQIRLLISPLELHEFDFSVLGCVNRGFDEKDKAIWECLAASQKNSLQMIRDRRRNRCTLTSGNDIIDYLVQFPNLKHLDLTTVRFSDEALQILAASCPRLEKLTLLISRGLSAEGIRTLEAFPSLEEVHFTTVADAHVQRPQIDYSWFQERLPRKLKILLDVRYVPPKLDISSNTTT
ncbi:uncharacterized protein LOC132195862 isoform X2 [Neocloeon triangulifer]|uniref:uncharacterized protein LOC132195862 isoform X2 n=1 Tax=Neocloeon triangulifer TaxID=2078957 RepID=UPI00286EC585|nr:uncharacterized protein LOC132195862 isoform X2 [Neocloeon triangulifer]XP_059474114.1 uncharacterized protein LOC132195862 isoform X2 [Neocloeon triangulifer]